MNGNKEKGFTLIELLIAAGVVAVVSLAFARMIVSASQANRAISQKLETIDFKQNVLTAFLSKSTCDCNVASFVFDSSVTPIGPISLGRVKSGCAGTAPNLAQDATLLPGSQTKLSVSTVQLVQIAPTGNPNEYQSFLQIQYLTENFERPLLPSLISVRFLTDPTSPLNAKSIVSCSTASNTFFPAYSSQVSISVVNPNPSTTFSFEPSNIGTDWTVPFTMSSVIPDFVSSSPVKVLVQLVGTINWNGCYSANLREEQKTFQVSLNYSLDGGATFTDSYDNHVIFNNGGSISMSRVFNLSTTQALRVKPRARFEQLDTLSPACVSNYFLNGTLSLISMPQ